MRGQDLRLKVLFVLPALEAGGAERVLITLMNNIDREKYEPVFLSVRGEGTLQYLIDPAIPFHSLGQKLSCSSVSTLFRKVKEIGPDVVVSTMAHMNFALLSLKRFFPQTRFIVREAITPSFLLQKYKLRGAGIKALYKNLYPRADLVLSPSQIIFDEFTHDLGMSSSNFQLLRNPVDEEKIRRKLEWDHTPEKTLRFVACGRLGKQKGFDRLIKRLSGFKPSCDWRLDILGEGLERPYLESLIVKNKLENNVFLRGLIKEPYSDFARADCFLLPSRFEGLPNVALESLACGTPVIATRESGGIAEIAAEAPAGAVTIVDNMDGFMAKMERVEPLSKTTPALSLLPKTYQKQAVFTHFGEILDCLTREDSEDMELNQETSVSLSA
ncbi:MAG: glycosyltransferase [Alphaproteobacteria bacterium]|nr:glycosyltransferase [Alphaproteobacteria bacterium]